MLRGCSLSLLEEHYKEGRSTTGQREEKTKLKNGLLKERDNVRNPQEEEKRALIHGTLGFNIIYRSISNSNGGSGNCKKKLCSCTYILLLRCS